MMSLVDNYSCVEEKVPEVLSDKCEFSESIAGSFSFSTYHRSADRTSLLVASTSTKKLVVRQIPSLVLLDEDVLQTKPGSSPEIKSEGVNAIINDLSCSNSSLSSKQIVSIYTCIDKIDSAMVSPDGEYILCAMHSKEVVEVFSLLDLSWTCRINEGPAGLIRASWTPDSRHIMCESDFGIEIRIWSLYDSSSVVISKMKHLTTQSAGGAQIATFSFSNCGKFLAVLHRIDLQDYVGVYSIDPWEELTKFKSSTTDACYISWLPTRLQIIVVDSPLHYKINIFSPSGEVISSFEAYENALGIRSVDFQWSCRPRYEIGNNSSGAQSTSSNERASDQMEISKSVLEYMSISSFDGKIRLLSTNSWQPICSFTCGNIRDMESTTVSSDDASYYFVEDYRFNPCLPSEGALVSTSFSTDRHSLSIKTTGQTKTVKSSGGNTIPISSGLPRPPSTYTNKVLKSLPRVSVDLVSSKDHPLMGVQWSAFSSDGKLLAGREESFPRCLWVWDVDHLQLVNIIVQQENICDAAWRPIQTQLDIRDDQPLLAFCCGTPRIYLWSKKGGVFWSDLPSTVGFFSITSLRWIEDGSLLILAGKDMFCTFSISQLVSTEKNRDQFQVGVVDENINVNAIAAS